MLNCQILNTNVKINNVTTTKEREKMQNLSTINKKATIGGTIPIVASFCLRIIKISMLMF